MFQKKKNNQSTLCLQLFLRCPGQVRIPTQGYKIHKKDSEMKVKSAMLITYIIKMNYKCQY